MSHRVCPWWLGWCLVVPLRRLWQHPRAILEPYVRRGMTVLEPGPGMGFFTLELARLVGAEGRVVAVDVQPRMLEALRGRAGRARLAERVETRLALGASLAIEDLAAAVDFVLAFFVVHEMPDAAAFFAQAASAMKPDARLLLAEPRVHVKEADFEATVRTAERAGLRQESRPAMSGSQSVVFRRAPSPS